MRFLALLLIVAGCDDRPGPPRFDAGQRADAGPRGDGGRDAGRAVDAAGDAGAPIDGGAFACVADPDLVYKLGEDPGGRDRPIGLAAGGSVFAIVWTETLDGRPDMFGVRMSSDGVLGTEQRITDNSAREQSPAVVAQGTSWVVAWADNAGTPGFEMRSRALTADVAGTGAVYDLTSANMWIEDAPSLFSGSTGVVAAWIEQDTVAGTQAIRARRLATDAMPSSAVVTASPTGIAPIALGELASGPVALWLDGGHVKMQRLSADGAMSGAAIDLDEGGNANGTVDAALSSSGGAVVFGALIGGVRREVRFRALDATGTRIGDERIIGEGGDASIADFAGGYAVSWRAPAAVGSELRIALVDPLGSVSEELTVTEIGDEGGRTTLRVSGDGQIAIAWADRAATQLDIRAAAVLCGVVP